MANNRSFKAFEDTLIGELKAAHIPYTLHWSKNSGVDAERLSDMYGSQRVETWRGARRSIFEDDKTRMRVFDNRHLERAGLI